MEQPHWSKVEQVRKRFFAQTHGMGYDDEGIHAALGVEHLEQFPGTVGDALNRLLEAKKGGGALEVMTPDEPPADVPDDTPEITADQLTITDEAMATACTALPESPALAWTRYQSPAGFEWSYTVRAGLPADLAAAALESIAAQVAAFERKARRVGWVPVLDGRNQTMHPVTAARPPAAHSAPAPVAQAQATPPPAPPAQAQATGEVATVTFRAAAIMPQMTPKGKRVYKVKGGAMMKSGVDCWPEVATLLQHFIGYDPETIAVGQEVDLLAANVEAISEQKADAKWPYKVTGFRLAQP